MALIRCPECSLEISDKAGKCPHCGLPLNLETDNAKKICPECKSNNIQVIKVMCESGTISSSSTGIGISSDLDIGVGKINSKSKTLLAEKYVPGTSPDNSIKGCGCFTAIIGLIFMVAASSSDGNDAAILGLFIMVVGFILLLIPRKESEQQKKWIAKAKLYDEGWICHKCGHTWIFGGDKNTEFKEELRVKSKLNDLQADIDASRIRKPYMKAFDLHIDDQYRINCPNCNRGLRLKQNDIITNSFECPQCKKYILFTRAI